MTLPRDARARERALDPRVSFVVQAPAGSGKTELLTRRILTLLATVEEPEQVVAITFTRKAAAEMRQRVVELLRAAHAGEHPANDYEAAGIALAARVLERDAVHDWRLLEDPQRLALGTIDALATRLAHRLPLTSTLGAPGGVAEDARDLYLEAAGRFVEERLERLDLVLLRLGNRFERLQSLLADLLGMRDQWMRYVMGAGSAGELREGLEAMRGQLRAHRLHALAACCPPILEQELAPLARRAMRWLTELAEAEGRTLDDKQRALVEALGELECLPGDEDEEEDVWRALANFLLTEKGACRVRLDKGTGFPSKSKAVARSLGTDEATLAGHKAEMQALLAALVDEEEFVARLHAIRDLPPPRYADEDWALLEQLVGLLPELVAELHLLFGERGRLDFPEIAQRAVTALGTEDQPTDLALSMDMDIRHVLVDEFQDTSRAQWSLFERLVAGWEPDDGRTFFVVGDPMQSIYRFREGDVALFLKARDEGIGAVRFESLRLEVNFRSTPPVIDWVNATFAGLFPKVADPNVGAVTYEPSSAHREGAAGGGEGAVVHALPGATSAEEARVIADLVGDALARDPAHTVGILVRSRAAARAIVPALHARDIRFRAVEMEALGERPVVRDLVSLTLALRFPHDRLHWLAVLRGPLCGLRLADLHALVGDDGQATVLERLADAARVARLGEDGRERVARFAAVAGPASERVARGSLVPWVEAVWLQLGGPAACRTATDLDAAERCLARLVELERDGRIWRRADVLKAVERLYASDPADEESARVQVMTVHKSKGLEFDTVILPALGRRAAQDAPRLINWYESTLDGEPHLLFAPIEAPGASRDAGGTRRDPVVKLVRELHGRAEAEERLRLLYVACTRARRHLHLTAPLALDESGEPRRPQSSSFLAPLFALVGAAHAGSARVADDGKRAEEGATTDRADPTERAAGRADPPPPLLRTERHWRLPDFDRFAWRRPRPVARDELRVEHDSGDGTARHVGTVVHRALLRLASLAEDRRAAPGDEDVARFALALRNLGVHETRLEEAAARVALAVANTLADERGRWILDPRHADPRSEWPLTVPELDEAGRFVGVRRVIVDRTFVDAGGTRWIVDYKSGSHEGADLDAFLDREADRYREQLERYADVLARVDARPTRVGLWFPLVRGWRELVPEAPPRVTPV